MYIGVLALKQYVSCAIHLPIIPTNLPGCYISDRRYTTDLIAMRVAHKGSRAEVLCAWKMLELKGVDIE